MVSTLLKETCEERSTVFEVFSNPRQNRRRLAGCSVAVLGAARSGISLARLLAASGAAVLLSDRKPLEQLDAQVRSLPDQGIRLECGGHSAQILKSDLICISPGLPLSLPILQQARRAGIPILGELEVASWFCGVPIAAITGSNGKTTTTQLAGEILKCGGPGVWIGGNIGTPLSALILEEPQPRAAVIEVSSFQLETIATFRPAIAAILNLSPNHLDRYAGYEEYMEAKLNILRNMNEGDVLLFNADDAVLNGKTSESPVRKLPFSASRVLPEGAWWAEEGIRVHWENIDTLVPLRSSSLRGPHNRYNMVAAAVIGLLSGIPPQQISPVVAGFSGLEHRLEEVARVDGVLFVNDSKATTVASLGYALQSFDEPIIVIAGGKDKGGDFAELRPLLKQRVRAAVLIGEAADRIGKAWEGAAGLQRAGTLQEAVRLARQCARRGDVVLLSPACSSFDMFSDYQERGRCFKEAVLALAQAGAEGQNHE